MAYRKIDLVVGANYGDEGKGTITARIAKLNPNEKIVNVLTNGGPQRGHSVCYNGITHNFHHFGSATPFKATTLFDKDFILNPMVFKEEYESLISEFHAILPTPLRNSQCKWTTPFDMMYNQMESLGNWKGTCGMGIWATLCRYVEMPNIPSFDEFCYTMPYHQKFSFLMGVRQYYESKIDVSAFPEYASSWRSPTLIDHFIKDCHFMFDYSEVYNPETLFSFNHFIFENGQGLLLNDNGVDDPEKTPSQTGSNTVLNLLKDIPNYDCLNIHYVTRPYLTRHGSLKFRSENVDGDIDKNSESNQYNKWQRDLLYSNLDLTDLRSTINLDRSILENGKKFQNISFTLDITHCDELDRSKQFQETFARENIKLAFHGNKIV